MYQIQLRPGDCGANCITNGEHPEVECACDECDYLMCCLESHSPEECAVCKDPYCIVRMERDGIAR